MRYLHLDYREFDLAESEQNLVICQSRAKEFTSVAEFLDATCKRPELNDLQEATLPEAKYLNELDRGGTLIAGLYKETGLTLRADTEIYVLQDEWNRFDVVLAADDTYLRYAWSTTA